MKRIIRNLVIAVPLATVGLTVANTGAAIAGPNGPVIIVQPKDDPQPPNGPKDIADAPKPKGPKDIADAPKDDGPKDKAPKPQSLPTGPATQPQQPQETVKVVKAVEKTVVSAKGSPDSIDRSDNLFVAGPAEAELVADDTTGGLDLTWLLLGGGIVTASGLALAARKRANA